MSGLNLKKGVLCDQNDFDGEAGSENERDIQGHWGTKSFTSYQCGHADYQINTVTTFGLQV